MDFLELSSTLTSSYYNDHQIYLCTTSNSTDIFYILATLNIQNIIEIDNIKYQRKSRTNNIYWTRDKKYPLISEICKLEKIWS
jgi:hypothetical protein